MAQVKARTTGKEWSEVGSVRKVVGFTHADGGVIVTSSGGLEIFFTTEDLKRASPMLGCDAPQAVEVLLSTFALLPGAGKPANPKESVNLWLALGYKDGHHLFGTDERKKAVTDHLRNVREVTGLEVLGPGETP